MLIRYDDCASKFEKAELTFLIRDIFASDRVGALHEIEVSIEPPSSAKDWMTQANLIDGQSRERHWLISIPSRRTGEFICTRKC